MASAAAAVAATFERTGVGKKGYLRDNVENDVVLGGAGTAPASGQHHALPGTHHFDLCAVNKGAAHTRSDNSRIRVVGGGGVSYY